MLDEDLAGLYGVLTRNLNKAVKRNIERFPKEFMFQLTKEEYENLKFHFGTSSEGNLKSQNVTSSGKWGGRRNLPYAFTEQGVAMLSGVLRSDTAVKISIQIMNTFVSLRKFIASNAQIFQRLDSMERKQVEYQAETDKKFEQIFDAIESKDLIPKKGIFFDGQVFDAYAFVSDLVRSAKKSMALVDNYVDEDVYHFGASLKDLGKKWFAFSKFDREAFKLLERLGLEEEHSPE